MQSKVLLPLTLTLSLREREHLSGGWDRTPVGARLPARPATLPLPKGEGLGEGKGGHQLNRPGLVHRYAVRVLNFRRALSFSVSLLLFATACQAVGHDSENASPPLGSAILATNGQSDWKIVLRADASSPETLAAGELARYVRAIAQAELPILKGSSPGAHTIAIDSGAGALDGFDLAVTTDHITIHGHTSRGALYGVYQLLEDMGCWWYYPGSLGEVVPAVSTLRLSQKTTRQMASFRERSVMLAYPFYYDRFEEWIDVLAKQRINNLVIYGQSLDWWKSTRAKYLPLLQARNMILEFGGHILRTFVPRDLFQAHPEYFEDQM